MKEVGSLSPVELVEYMRLYVEKQKEESELLRNAVLNALGNFHKKKEEPFIELFPMEKNIDEQELLKERALLFGNTEKRKGVAL